MKYIHSTLKRNVSPYKGQKPTPEVKTEDIMALLRLIVARRIQQFLHATFAYGLMDKTNPNIDISGIDYGLDFNPVTGRQTVGIKNKP
jgi:hypothetical protein